MFLLHSGQSSSQGVAKAGVFSEPPILSFCACWCNSLPCTCGTKGGSSFKGQQKNGSLRLDLLLKESSWLDHIQERWFSFLGTQSQVISSLIAGVLSHQSHWSSLKSRALCRMCTPGGGNIGEHLRILPSAAGLDTIFRHRVFGEKYRFIHTFFGFYSILFFQLCTVFKWLFLVYHSI